MKNFYLILFSFCSFCSFAQVQPSYAEQLAKLEAEMDSMSIFSLIDSLLFLDESNPSEIFIRLGYTTNVTSAGRDYGVTQRSLSPGISIYHKSGLYADLSGYWNSGTDPAYNPTVASVGYLGYFKNYRWNYTFDAERWIYNPSDTVDNPLSTSLGTSLSYNFKLGFASVDYSFLFGDQTAHRIIGNLAFRINLGKIGVFKSISLIPSISMMVGDEDITQLRITNQPLSERTARRIERITSFSDLTDRQQRFLSTLISRSFQEGKINFQTRNSLLSDLRNARNLSPANQQALLSLVEDGFEVSEFTESNAFGILNYAFTLPLSLNTSRFNFLLSYTYSIPVELPAEEFIELDPVGYFGASVSYRIQLK